MPEPKRKRRKWRDKAPEHEGVYRANRRRTKGNKGRKLNRMRSEYCERTFAHVCQTGGSRRTWLRGLENVEKVHSLKFAAFNIGLLLRKIFGLSKPRNWEASQGTALAAAILATFATGNALMSPSRGCSTRNDYSFVRSFTTHKSEDLDQASRISQKRGLLTGC